MKTISKDICSYKNLNYKNNFNVTTINLKINYTICLKIFEKKNTKI